MQRRKCVTGTTRSINELAGSPNVTAIGGTEFTPDYEAGNDVGFVAESVWNDGSGAAGGGESRYFKKPKFQKGIIPTDKKRDVPDISFGASPESPGFFYGSRDGDGAPTVNMLRRRHQHRRSDMGRHQPADPRRPTALRSAI